MNSYYIYALWVKWELHPFYIGKGCGERYIAHFKEEELWNGKKFKILSSGKKRWFNVNKLSTIRNFKDKIQIIFLHTNLSEQEAFDLEIKYIDLWKTEFDGGYLTNKSRGGESVTMTPEVKNKLRIARLGTKISDEDREKRRNLFKGEKNPFYGKTHSDSTKQKIAKSRIGKTAGSKNPMCRPEVKAKITGDNNPRRKHPEINKRGAENHLFGVKAWEHPKVLMNQRSIQIWLSAIEIYKLWVNNNKPTYTILAKIYNVEPGQLLNMVNRYFRKDWNPNLDNSWLNWKNEKLKTFEIISSKTAIGIFD